MPGQSAKNETQLVKAIEGRIRGQWPDAWLLKVHGGGYQRVGVPDLLVCVEGLFIAMEVKHQKPGESVERLQGRVTVSQRKELRDLEKAGAACSVVWSVDQAVDLIWWAIGQDRP